MQSSISNGNFEVKYNYNFLNIINSIPNPIIVTNADLSIRYVNPAFVQLTGWTSTDVIGTRAPYPWWPASRHQEYLAELAKVKTQGKHKSDWLFVRKDGSEFWIKVMASPVVKNGEVQFMLASWQDITQNMKEQVNLQNKVLEIEQAQFQTMEDIWLKLRNPLTGIKGCISSLLQNGVIWGPQKTREFLLEANRQADRLEAIIQDFSILWLSESGQLKLNRGQYQITEILAEADKILKQAAADHVLKISLQAELPDILVDKTLIINVLRNLVENAARFSPTGGKIELDTMRQGSEIVIQVDDEGQGVNCSKQNNLFERVESGLPGEGSMGLRICKGIIEAHGGRIWVENVPGAGARFSISLPVILFA